ncbi:MAG: phosphatidate cytidylyltransferase [Armatimonadota bacterium]
MLTRLITIVIAVPIVATLVFWPGGMPFAGLAGAAAVLALFEFYRAVRKGGAHPHFLPGLAAGLVILYFGGNSYTESQNVIVPVFTALILLSLALELKNEPRAPFINVGVTVLGVCYVFLLLMHFIWLRNIHGTGPTGSEWGAWLVMFALIATWALDTGAYLVGRFFGKTKIAPSISPGKTIEGSIGGFVFAIIAASIVAAIIGIPLLHGLILGALIGITGQIGDFVGSALKREVGIKDFGALLPGHGGVLDRIDSLLYTGPVVFWYITLFLSKLHC